MPSYDSDSDVDDAKSFTETSVLLGYASKDAGEDSISRLGGSPEWLNPDVAPSASLARCKVCNEMMVLLLQLNGELPEKFPGHDRRLYVFSCRKQACRRKQGSIRAVRGTKISKEAAASAALVKEAKAAEDARKKAEASKPKNDGPGLGEALFGAKPGASSANPFASSANPFSSNSASASASANPFSSGPSNPFASAPAAPKPDAPKAEPPKAEEVTPKDSPKPLPKPYYEILEPEAPAVPQNVSMDVDDATADSGPGSGMDKEVFESSMDAIFQKFADRLAQNPDQSIRYEFGGQPLIYSKKDAVGKVLTAAAAVGRSGMPGCGNCGAGRVFEVQLTPQAITELESEELGLEGMDWGTIIVGVCEADCQERTVGEGEAGYLEEWCGVQWEELQQ
ncbi:20S rRNA accumulation protein 4 like [Verticillium longisporum]|uniref:20S rRNA accumulation protein 4 like n=1 Tax=Verticillium longisporum TaxID=100787 RepID=A0A8I3AGQ0_VERLO|nr:20S rRNA accumulation protein 4 like [Verticillium longisporum]